MGNVVAVFISTYMYVCISKRFFFYHYYMYLFCVVLFLLVVEVRRGGKKQSIEVTSDIPACLFFSGGIVKPYLRVSSCSLTYLLVYFVFFCHSAYLV